MQKELLMGELVFLIHHFLSPEECADYISASEMEGYEDAPITMGSGAIMLKEYRDNMRVMVDDPEPAARLFARARPFLNERLGGRTVSALNERLRYYRYDIGQNFSPHYDGSYRRSDREESLVTFMVYLNDGYTGGTTDFYDEDGKLRLRVSPEEGAALVFRHRLLHGGAAVESGRKYVLRTDVMYAEQPFLL